jgi:hypothetical protein
MEPISDIHMKHTLTLLMGLLLTPLAVLHAADAPISQATLNIPLAVENTEFELLKKSLGMVQDLPLRFGKLEWNTATPRQGARNGK